MVFHTSKIIIFFLILPCDRRDRNRLSTLTLDRRCDAETSRNKFVDRVREYNTRGRIRLFAKDYKYTRKGSLLPSLASVESMFGKRATIHPIHVRLRTREVRAANTYACAPRKSHSVFRHRLVAMLCRNGEKVTSNAVNRSEANDSDEFSGGPPPIYVLRSRVYCAQKAHRNRRLSSLFSHASRRDPRIVRNRRARRSATRRSSTETIVTENLDVTEPRGTREWPARLQRTRAKFGSCPRPYFVPGAANASIAPQTPCTSLVRVSNESRSLRSERRKTLLVHRRAPLALSAYGTEPTCQADGDARPMRAQSLMRENLDA